jgi:AraC-like DNA-binding protein
MTPTASRHSRLPDHLASLAPLPLRHRLGGYREYESCPSLARHVEAIWVHRTHAGLGLAECRSHRVLPDPSFSIAFGCFRAPDGMPINPRLLAIGPKTRPHPFSIRPGYEVTAVKLKVEWVLPLLGVAPFEHADSVTDLALVHRAFAAELDGPLLATHSSDEALAILTASIMGRVASADTHAAPRAAVALELVRRAGGSISIGRVAGAMGLSVRHLRRVVRWETDLSLKNYARAVRVVQAIVAADKVGERGRPAWARLAAEAGYWDQAHLIRECQELCGLTPQRLFEERRAQSNQVGDFSRMLG